MLPTYIGVDQTHVRAARKPLPGASIPLLAKAYGVWARRERQTVFPNGSD